jgi:uncharacterized membrane protein
MVLENNHIRLCFVSRIISVWAKNYSLKKGRFMISILIAAVIVGLWLGVVWRVVKNKRLCVAALLSVLGAWGDHE